MNGGVAFRPRQARVHRAMDVNQVFWEFADATSMHGVPRIINARSLTARIFWSIICICAFVMFMWQTAILLERYYSYPKKVNVEITQSPVEFPWVSVCNTDHLDLLTVNMLQGLIDGENVTDGLDENLSRWLESYEYFWDTSVDFFMGFSFGESQNLTAVYSRQGITANLGVELASMGGISRDDFIVSCRYMGDKCNITEYFFKFFDPYYFNCFTFQPHGSNSPRVSRRTGAEYGLTMLLFIGSAGQLTGLAPDIIMPGMDETYSALTSGRGARVVVHSPHTAANPGAASYDAPPGFSVTLGVRARENVRIPSPWGNCTEADKTKEYQYTLRDCQNDCLQKKIMDRCDCIDNKVSIPSQHEGMSFCLKLPDEFCPFNPGTISHMTEECATIRNDWSSKVQCPDQVFKDMILELEDLHTDVCACSPPCRDIVYESAYSLAPLPENINGHYSFYSLIEEFLKNMPEEKKKVLQAKHGENFADEAASYISRVTVYIADNNVLKTSESPDYEAIRLISDIGGQLGLWIGISVMTLFEVLQLIADVCLFITAGSGQVRKNKDRRPPRVDRVADSERSAWSHGPSVQSLPERERWYAAPGTPPGERWHPPAEHSPRSSPTHNWQAGSRTPPSENFRPLLGHSSSGSNWHKPPGNPPGDRRFVHRRANSITLPLF